MTAWLVAFLAGAAAGWAAARFLPRPDPAPRPGPEPGLRVSWTTLDWLRRALGARAAWALVPGAEETPPAWLEATEGAAPAGEAAALEHRVRAAAATGHDLVERFDAGTLVVRAKGGAACGALLPAGREPGAVADAERELDRLLQALERAPRLAAIERVDANPGEVETLDTAAHRLAFEIEKLVPGASIVAMRTSAGICVMGRGGDADPRLSGAVAPPGSALQQFLDSEAPEWSTADPPLERPTGDRRRRERPALLLPIESAHGRIGAVVLWPRAERVPPGALGPVLDLLRRSAPRLEHARTTHEWRHGLEHDALTGLGNRRRLERAMHHVAVDQAAVIAIDVDHFKRLNDTLGHPAGDDALKHVAGVLRGEVRSGDVLARVGGEEFVVWLPGASLAEAARVAERIRARLEGTIWGWQGRPWPLRASLGVAHWGETTRSVENLLAQADGALYASKQAGRNRVTTATG